MASLLGVGLIGAAAMASAEPSIQNIGWLVGEWTFSDRSTPAAGFEAIETGVRHCSSAIDAKYIRCESIGTSDGRQRTYVFYFAYDAVDQRFEMVAMHGNWPRTLLYSGQASDGGNTLELLSDPYLEGGTRKRTWAVIKYDGHQTYTWETGNFPDGASERGPVRFRDVATRSPRQAAIQ